MGEIRYIIIAKICEVAGTLSILDGCLKKNVVDAYLVSTMYPQTANTEYVSIVQ